MQIKVPTLLAIAKRIWGLQYSWDKPWILIHTWVDGCLRVKETKFFNHWNNLRTLWNNVQAFTNLTHWTTSKEEKANSKNPFPNEVTPYFPIDGHNSNSLFFKFTTVSDVDPFDQTTLPWKWCLKASTLRLYSSSEIVMASLSLFRQGIEVD